MDAFCGLALTIIVAVFGPYAFFGCSALLAFNICSVPIHPALTAEDCIGFYVKHSVESVFGCKFVQLYAQKSDHRVAITFCHK